MVLTKQAVRDIIAFNSPISESDLILLIENRAQSKVNLNELTKIIEELQQIDVIFKTEDNYVYNGPTI